MAVFYLLHEYYEKYNSDINIGKRFARITIIGFIIYYILYFSQPLDWYYTRKFVWNLIKIDIIASSIFYGGIFGLGEYCSVGTQHIKTQAIKKGHRDHIEEINEQIIDIDNQINQIEND